MIDVNNTRVDLMTHNRINVSMVKHVEEVSINYPASGMEGTAPDLLVQDVFSTAAEFNGVDWIFPDISGENNHIVITGYPIATFDGTAYLQAEAGALDGLSIFDFVGTATPSIVGDAINFTSGTAHYMKLSNGKEYYFHESDGIKIYAVDGEVPPLVVIQDVFSTATSNQVFSDQSGNGNDVIYKNVQVGYSDGIANSLETPISEDGDVIRCEATIDKPNKSTTNTIYELKYDDLTLQFRVDYGGGDVAVSRTIQRTPSIVVVTNSTSIPINEPTKFIWEYNRIDNTVYWEVSNTIGVDSGIDTGFISPSNNSVFQIQLLKNLSEILDGNIYNSTIMLDSILKAHYTFQSGDDEIEIDNSGNGNHATWVGAILADAKGTRVDGIDSELIKNGYTLFQKIADPTKYITAPYTDAGLPTLTSYAGYNKIAEITKNIVSDNKILYDGIQVAGLETDATFIDINSLEDSPTIEIVKDVNTVSNLIVKA